MNDDFRTYSVGVFLDRVSELLREFSGIFVVGEISSFRQSGQWVSLTLRDQEGDGTLSCFLSSAVFNRIGVALSEGMVVKVGGRPHITKRSGNFGFFVSSIEPIGEGSLRQAYELLKRQLKKEGLFEQKRELPECISSVGIITSLGGVVSKDFAHNLRALGIKVYLYDARVEGREAMGQIVSGINWFNSQRKDIDALIIMRGGGSLESLQAFDNEVTARAVFASKIPTIAAIGHHVDVPIASFVADVSVSTPTAAAHLVNQSWERVLSMFPRYAERLSGAIGYVVDSVLLKINRSSDTIISGFENKVLLLKERLDAKEAYLKAVNPEENLKRGYSLVFQFGKILKQANALKAQDEVLVKLHRGEFSASVLNINEKKSYEKET